MINGIPNRPLYFYQKDIIAFRGVEPIKKWTVSDPEAGAVPGDTGSRQLGGAGGTPDAASLSPGPQVK